MDSEFHQRVFRYKLIECLLGFGGDGYGYLPDHCDTETSVTLPSDNPGISSPLCETIVRSHGSEETEP